MEARQYDKMAVGIFESNAALGAAVADDVAAVLINAVDQHGAASIILATGNSQLSFVEALRNKPDLPWNRIAIFHMDEYLGMSIDHPASFRRWMDEKLLRFVDPQMFHGLAGDAPDVDAEMARYTELLAQHQPVACVLGIGENGHLAFNDPPADFNTAKSVHVVELAEEARRQQVGEGHFATLDDVPQHALSLTVPALLRPAHVFAVVPESRKAAAVKAALEGPITPDCPASILRTKAHVKLYLDRDSAALLTRT